MWRAFPQTKSEAVLYCVDMAAISVGLVAKWRDYVTDYILLITALSITITLGVKVYNWLTPNNKNKKI